MIFRLALKWFIERNIKSVTYKIKETRNMRHGGEGGEGGEPASATFSAGEVFLS